MATFYVDPENGTDTQAGLAVVKKTGLTVTSGTNTVTVDTATGIVAGMKVLSTDMNNSGGLVTTGTTVSSVVGTTVTLSANFLSSSASATLVFSGAFKSLSTASAAASPGDTIRIKKSPDPISMGMSATWTQQSSTITLPSEVTRTVENCEQPWVFGTAFDANYTGTSFNSALSLGGGLGRWNMNTETGAGTAVQGTNRLRIQWYWSGYSGTSGAQITDYNNYRAAMNGTKFLYYKAFPEALDLSSYTRLSMYMGYSNASESQLGYLKLRLCSDTLGQTPVATFSISPVSGFRPIVLTNIVNGVETPFGSNIRSISLVLENINLPASRSSMPSWTTTFSNIDLYLDNIVACLPASNAAALTHNVLIGKNVSGDHWYPIRSIDGTAVTFMPWSYSGYAPGYTNPTQTNAAAPIYRRDMFPLNTLGAVGVSKSGDQDNPITYDFGYSDVDMSVKNGMSFYNAYGTTEYLNLAGNYNIVDGLGISGSNCHLVGNSQDTVYYALYSSGWFNTIRNCSLTATRGGIMLAYGHYNTLSNVRIWGSYNPALSFHSLGNSNTPTTGITVDNCSFDGTTADYAVNFVRSYYYNQTKTTDNIRFTNCSIANNNSGGIYFSANNRLVNVYIQNCLINLLGSSAPSLGGFIGEARVVDTKVNTTTPVTWGNLSYSRVYFHNYNQVNNDHRVFYELNGSTVGRVVSYTGNDRRINTGVAWRIQPLNASVVHVMEPISFPIAQVYVDANKTVTFTAYMRRDSLTAYGSLICRGGQLAGIATDVSASLTGAINTWVPVTITLNPTASGVVEIEAQGYGGTTFSIDVDDLSVSQA